MNRYPIRWLWLLVFLLPMACKREPSTDLPTPSRTYTDSVSAPPPMPKDLPAAWPTGDAMTIALAPEQGATSLTKALYEHGDVVLEQVWPDGKRERWWYAPDGTMHRIDKDGSERAEEAP
jgi:hypothetical protein